MRVRKAHVGGVVVVVALAMGTRALAHDAPRLADEFPVNDRGLTFGSLGDPAADRADPDLIRAFGADGRIGYVRAVDLAGPAPTGPEEALARERTAERASPTSIPLYDVDGVTVIGSFVIGGSAARTPDEGTATTAPVSTGS